jgi:hypothetical protein
MCFYILPNLENAQNSKKREKMDQMVAGTPTASPSA